MFSDFEQKGIYFLDGVVDLLGAGKSGIWGCGMELESCMSWTSNLGLWKGGSGRFRTVLGL